MGSKTGYLVGLRCMCGFPNPILLDYKVWIAASIDCGKRWLCAKRRFGRGHSMRSLL